MEPHTCDTNFCVGRLQQAWFLGSVSIFFLKTFLTMYQDFPFSLFSRKYSLFIYWQVCISVVYHTPSIFPSMCASAYVTDRRVPVNTENFQTIPQPTSITSKEMSYH